MAQFFFVVNVYFFYELIINGLIPTFESEGDTLDPMSTVFQQFFDLTIVVALLFVLRTRRWPEYFSVELFEMQFG